MKRRNWFLVILFFVGLVLFFLGQHYMFGGQGYRLGFGLSLSGLVLWAVLLAIGLFYVARVRLKILWDASARCIRLSQYSFLEPPTTEQGWFG
jgi:hypothetical protein